MIKLRSVFAVAVVVVLLVAPARAVEPAGAKSINDNAGPFATISDGQDPFSVGLVGEPQVIDDGPDPISCRVITAPAACVVDGPESCVPWADDDVVVHGVMCRIGWTAVVVVWVAQ